MHVEELAVPGAWVFEPIVHGDDRGVFLECFRADTLAEHVGHPLDLRQANWSTSKAGVVRGVHFADIPPGQAKYVMCLRGAILDVVVDIRTGSPTFGRWACARLDENNRRAVYVAEGLGHAFMALADDTAVVYLCSATYNPGHEHGINPLDPDLGIPWPSSDDHGRALTPALSARDEAAPTLAQAARDGILPSWAQATEYYQGKRAYQRKRENL
ncbi:MAG: dTDP-4-dehydrorhamnose 3,5-epimerase [Mycobacterium sp.]|nr:dTDP-4-dehydrorhamnose 3,5-epimerase [Mycobacterium sp.]